MGRCFLLFFIIAICTCCKLDAPIAAFEQIDLDVVNKRECAFRVENARLFPLETTEESLIARVDKIISKAPYIYILDSRQKVIFIFDYDGHYLTKIDKIGRAGGEYASIEDFDVGDNGDLFILSAYSKKIIKYAYPAYISFDEIRINCSMTEICVVGDKIYTGGMHTPDGLVGLGVLDITKGTVDPLVGIRAEFDLSSDDRFEVKPRSFYKSSGNVLFNQRFSRQVHELGQSGWQIPYEFSSGLPVWAAGDKDDFRGFRSIFHVGRIILGQLWQNQFYYPPLYIRDIESGKESLCNLWDMGLPFLTDISTKDGHFIMAISADRLKRIQNNEIVRNVVSKVSENDNPLLLEFDIVANP